MKEFLKKLGYTVDIIPFIPVSGTPSFKPVYSQGKLDIMY